MEKVPCPKCGRLIDLAVRRCPDDGFEVDSSHILAVATTIDPTPSGTPPRPRPSGPVPARSLVGTKLGRYVIEELLGRGGMATVWKARHEELGGFVAIKVLDQRIDERAERARSSKAEGDDAQERFLREAKVSAQLNHDHVVKVIDFARDPEVGSYIVMELLSGLPLDRIIAAEAPLSESRTIAIALQIADALAAAHAVGIVHRDLKPGNVFVTRALGAELIKVVDFGIAKLSIDRATALTVPGKLFGTPLYMSPEQWDNAGVGPRSDIYSFGVVLYEMLTGRLPISGGAMTEMARNVALTSPKSMRAHRASISPALDALVLRCLAKEPEGRYASMTEVGAALRVLAAGGRPAEPGGFRPRYVLPVVVGAAMVGTFLFLRLREPAPPHAAVDPPPPKTVAAATAPPDAPTADPQTTPIASSSVPSASVTAPAQHPPPLPIPLGGKPNPRAGHDAGKKPPSSSASDDDDLLRKK